MIPYYLMLLYPFYFISEIAIYVLSLDSTFLLYIMTMNVYLFFPSVNSYWGTIPFILSDIIITSNIKSIQWTTWPLYYCSLIYMYFYF